MKIIEILNESPKDEKVIQGIADAITQIVQSEVKAREDYYNSLGDDDDYEEVGEISVGKLGDAFAKHNIDKQVFGHLSNRLRHTKLDIMLSTTLGGDKPGLYFPRENRISVHYPMFNDQLKPNERISTEELSSNLVHELRHRLDDSLSRGWAMQSEPTKTKQNGKHRLGDSLPYYRETKEINARTSEVQRMLSKWLTIQMKKGEVPAPNSVVNKINQLMREKNLVDIFDTKDDTILAKRKIAQDTQEQIAATDNKQYKQVMKRIMRYYNSEVERIQNERY